MRSREEAGWKPALRGFALLVSLLLGLSVSAEQGIGESGLFTVDTRYGFSGGAGVSGFFRVDTRLSGSAGDAASGAFIVDTRGATFGNAVFTGWVTDPSGLGLGGTTVSALQSSVVRAQTGTDPGGNYTLPSLPAGTYQLRAEKTDHLTGLRYGVSVLSGETATQNFTLAGKPVAPVVVATARTAPPADLVVVTGTQLKVFTDGAFKAGGTIDRNKKTVVFTHGWNSKPDEWAKGMAANMFASGVTSANLVAWDWEKAAGTGIGLSLALWRTPGQGHGLGSTLASLLETDYDQPIHFIGHSLGTLVNATAANYLHAQAGPGFASKRTHITLLDDAEVAYIEGLIFVGGYVVAGFESVADSAEAPPLLVSPVPNEYAWVDNYISLVGLRHGEAVNTVLTQSPERVTPFFDLIEMHAYAAKWYSSTVAAPQDGELGNRYSFERMGLREELFSSSPYPPAAVFSQIQGASERRLKRLTGELEIQAALLSVRPAVGTVRLGLQKSLEVAEGAVQKTGSVLLDVGQSLIPHTPTGTPVFTGTANSTPAYYTDRPIETMPVWSFQVGLQTQPILPLPLPRAGKQSLGTPAAGELNPPPCVWIPVAIPANAAVFSFDFTFSGEPADDTLSASVGGTNVFALEARFMPVNTTLNSGPIDVTRWAGQTVELFFGVLGGTSTNANVTVNGMRFYQVEKPALAVELVGAAAVLSWPATVQGYALESADSLGSVNGWTPVMTTPTIIGLRNVVTNALSGEARFFRLRQE